MNKCWFSCPARPWALRRQGNSSCPQPQPPASPTSSQLPIPLVRMNQTRSECREDCGWYTGSNEPAFSSCEGCGCWLCRKCVAKGCCGHCPARELKGHAVLRANDPGPELPVAVEHGVGIAHSPPMTRANYDIGQCRYEVFDSTRRVCQRT